MSDFLTSKRTEIEARLNELRPLIDEFRQLEAAAAALAGVGLDKVQSTVRRGPGRPKGSTTTTRTRATGRKATGRKGKGGRPRGSGTRAIQALELVKTRPGITIAEMAKEMGIQQNYLYRVLPALEADKKVKKKGRGWHPREA